MEKWSKRWRNDWIWPWPKNGRHRNRRIFGMKTMQRRLDRGHVWVYQGKVRAATSKFRPSLGVPQEGA